MTTRSKAKLKAAQVKGGRHRFARAVAEGHAGRLRLSLIAQMGGETSSGNMTRAERKARAQKAAQARWKKRDAQSTAPSRKAHKH